MSSFENINRNTHDSTGVVEANSFIHYCSYCAYSSTVIKKLLLANPLTRSSLHADREIACRLHLSCMYVVHPSGRCTD